MQAEVDRRDHSLKGRVKRLSYPLRKSAGEWLESQPCATIGHKWKEVPSSLRSFRARASGKLEFRCERCSRASGFSN